MKGIRGMRKKILIGASLAAVFMPYMGLAAGPYLQVSPASGAPGSTVLVSGYQFEPSTNVLVSLAGTSTGAVVTNGSFTAQLTVPNVSAGSYAILATSPQREQASTSFNVLPANLGTLYYPHARPNTWYLLPGQELWFSGKGFMPNSEVTIQGGSGELQATSDSSGAFSIGPIDVPYAWQNSRQHFVITGVNAAYTIPITLTVGTFYPRINPSTYYVAQGQTMSAKVSGFAPGEPIMLLVNGALVAQKTSVSGATSFEFTTPSSGTGFTLTAEGAYSHVMVSPRAIRLY